MRFCKKCILPDTRPNLFFGKDGVCNACKSHSTKQNIDWSKRERLFTQIAKNINGRSNGYDCVIPVSGGKDSTWQVIKCLEYGLNPLTVTWKTPARTNLGQNNLDNLVNLGVDHIDYQVSPKVEAKFLIESLKRFGATAIPMHMALHSIPLKIAVKFNIPLIIWGENPAFEYGGTESEQKGFKLDKKWLKNFGVTQGTSAKDWVSDKITKKELTPYFGASEKDLEKANVLAIFLGYYFKWDVEKSLKVSQKYGFMVRKEGPKVGYYNYADIDCDFISIHHWMKWYKFGFTRTMDNLSLEIRNGRITREETLKILKNRGDETPYEDIEKFCEFTGISKKMFFSICESFRNKEIWTKKGHIWSINNFIISDWNWS